MEQVQDPVPTDSRSGSSKSSEAAAIATARMTNPIHRRKTCGYTMDADLKQHSFGVWEELLYSGWFCMVTIFCVVNLGW